MCAITPEQVQQFETDGYLILENLIDLEDIDLILKIAQKDPQLAENAKTNQNYDGDEGIGTRLVYRGELSEDVYSAFAQSRRIIDVLSILFEDQVSYYYHLCTLKNPGTGGWQWHQDYGYHYKEFFTPKFMSVMVALDEATAQNGCLRVVKGSNTIGRLEHWESGSQLIADPERVGIALEELDEVHCELKPGSVLFFHGNILHASDTNQSDQSRWALIYAYVARHNICMLDKDPRTPVDPWDDEVVRGAAKRHWEAVAAPD